MVGHEINQDSLDTQFAFGLTHPTPGTFYSTAGSPPFIPDEIEDTNQSEPYANVSSMPVSEFSSAYSDIVVVGLRSQSPEPTPDN